MKVLSLPDYSDGNPYQHRLTEALEKYNVSVRTSKSVGRLPILRAIIRYGKPDILHLHWTHSFSVANNFTKSIILSCRFLLEILVVRILKIKIVWTVHNIINHENRYKNVEFLCNKMFIKLCNHFIIHCLYGKIAFLNTYKLPKGFEKNITVIPHGNYIGSYENELDCEQARTILYLNKEQIVFLFLGFIRPYKGVFQLIETFQQLKSPRACLLIAGRVKNEAVKTELIGRCQLDKRIHVFPCFIPDKDIQLYMNAADVVVLPFQDILTSGSALLAMSFGKAVILPRRGCVTEIMDSQGAFLYDPDEKEGLFKTLQQALMSDLATMGKHNYEEAKRFDWDTIAQQTCEVYYKC